MFRNWLNNESRSVAVCAAVSAPALACSYFGWLKGVVPFDPAWLCVLLCGIPIVAGAASGLICEGDIKADVLVSLALLASLTIGEYFAAGEVAFIMQLGTLIEDYTAGKSRAGIEKLVSMSPRSAKIVRNGKIESVSVEQIRAGDEVAVLAGETVPVDGVITSGEASIDQSVMTGESVPVDKKPGDNVISGTVSRCGAFVMRASGSCADSALQRMILLAENADADKARIVRLADHWASWLVLFALAAAVAAWLLSGEFIRGVTVLVVFCPCAFILATPAAVAAGMGNAAARGILIRSGDALERLALTDRIAFDKTGTLTEGKPLVTEIVSLCPAYGAAEILRLTALAEKFSEHPLGRAIVEHAAQDGTEGTVTDFHVTAGMGVSAIVDGHRVEVGRKPASDAAEEAEQRAARLREQGCTVVFVTIDGAVAGLIALADRIRPGAAAAVTELRQMGIEPLLLTGDAAPAAERIAAQTGITRLNSGMMPEDKLNAVREACQRGEKLCMTGDGVNDALALRAAYASIAMGGIGSDIAIESACAVLVKDDIGRLPGLFRLARRVMKKISQNILLSLVINLSAVTLSAAGILSPVTGALWHNAGSVLVVVNAALLLRDRSLEAQREVRA